jgi:GntR family transcriptional regulator
VLHFQIDPGSPAPTYRQLMAQVQYYVASGTLKAGQKLPSIRELARYLGVNPSTVVKAYGELEHAGVIERRQGSGVFVQAAARPPSKRELERALRVRARTLAVEAKQMGADPQLVRRIVTEELQALEAPDQPAGEHVSQPDQETGS